MKINMGRRLKELRIKKGMTQLGLAKKMDVDARTISSWENNRTEPKMYQIQKLCSFLDCDEYELTGIATTDTTKDASVIFSSTDVTILELYHKLSAENKNKLLVYMIELGQGEN